MKLTANNIRFVKELVDETNNTSKWFVSLKGNDYRDYPATEKLPKTVQDFISSKEKEVFQVFTTHTFYIYR